MEESCEEYTAVTELFLPVAFLTVFHTKARVKSTVFIFYFQINADALK